MLRWGGQRGALAVSRFAAAVPLTTARLGKHRGPLASLAAP